MRFGLKTFYPMFKRAMSFPVFTYLSVGASNTLFNIILFIITFKLFENNNNVLSSFALEIATIISFATTVITGFWLNKNFVFNNSNNEKEIVRVQFIKYFLVSLQGQFSDYIITKTLVVFLLMNETVAYIISTIIMLCVNYLLQKHFTFKSKQ
jgi:putative flippase GtrA